MHPRPATRSLDKRLKISRKDVATTAVSVEESMRGRLAEIRRSRAPHDKIGPYERLVSDVEFFAAWIVLPWDAEAADHFLRLRRERVRIGTMDLKIACLVIAHDATLLTRNASDFAHVPGLRFENWLD